MTAPHEPQPAASTGVLKRFIDGEFSLPITFWAFGLGGQTMLGLPYAIVRANGGEQAVMLAAGVTALVGIIYKIMFVIAVWNSASKASHTANGWKLAAKMVALIWLVGPFIGLVF